MAAGDGGAGWWRRRSLRARITVLTTLVLAVALLGGSLLAAALLQRGLVGALDARAGQRAGEVARLVAEDALPATLGGPDSAALVQVLDPAGRVVAASPDASRVVPLLSPEEVSDAVADGGPVTLPGDRTGYGDGLRVLAVATERGPVVVVALPLTGITDSLRLVRLALLVGVPLLLGGLAAAVWATVGRALRPVEQLRAAAEAVPAGEPSRRLPVPEPADEVRRLALTLNGMLARLEAGGERQRAFVADAAHELRSPLAALRTTLEVALAHPAPGEDPATLRAVLDDVLRLGRLVDDLLLLARAEHGPGARAGPVDLADVAGAVVPALARRAAVRVRCDLAPAPASGDPEALARVVRNLVENALRHATGAVGVTTAATPAGAELVVDDDGPGIPLADRERVFDRFARLDAPRSREAGGAGLGLAIARRVVEGHGGTVTAGDAPAGGARLRVVLPAAPPPSAR